MTDEPRHLRRRMAPASYGLALAALALAAMHGLAVADTAGLQSQHGVAAAVRQAVLGIVSYSRWPGGPRQLRLCVLPGAANAGDLLQGPMAADDYAILPVSLTAQDQQLGRVCDIIYSGPLAPEEWVRLRTAFAGRPVLTITEGDPSCIAGAMFCLDTSRVPVGFAVNLDSVARSGIRVSPQVLLLGRRRTPP